MAGGAYRVRADRPVALMQLSPHRFRRDESCVVTDTRDDLGCFSFSNDASILLPVTSLGERYRVDTHGGELAGSFVALAAPADLEVTIRPKAALTAGPSVPAAEVDFR